MPWIIYDQGKAQTAGCDMETSETIYVLTVEDVVAAYENRRDNIEEDMENDGLPPCPEWGELPQEKRLTYTRRAQRFVEIYFRTRWLDVIEDAINDVDLDEEKFDLSDVVE